MPADQRGMIRKAVAAGWATLKARLSRLGKTLALVWRCSPTLTLSLSLLTLIGVVLPLLVAYVGKALVDAVVAHQQAAALRLCAIELGLMVLQSLQFRGQGLLRMLLGARLSVDINVKILDKAISLDLSHFEDPKFYDQLTRARREASSRPLGMVGDVLQLVQGVLTLVGYVGLLWTFSPLAVMVLLLAALPAAAGEVRFSRAAFRLRNFRAPETRRLNYIEYILGSDEHAKEVMVLGLGKVLLDRYRTVGESLYRDDRSLAIRRAFWGYLLSLLATLAFYGCYVVIVGLAVSGKISLGDMTLYVVAFRQGQQAFQSTLSSLGGIYEHDLYMSNLFDFLAIPTAQQRALTAQSTLPSEPQRRGIEFEQVSFRYPGETRYALRNVSLSIPAGQSLALVGHNGAGKTTFIKLLCGLYQPTEGRILLDGKDLQELPPDEVRRRIGVVFQDFGQYQFSVRDNVAFGSIQHFDDKPRVERALDRGGADEFVRGFPEGMDALLGRWFHKGVELSGGQWQRIALARAFMREEADILVLDEPTAALDAEAEHKIFERFRELTQGRTAILISHRFPTVRMADRIVVLEGGPDGGHIAEQGTHSELVSQGGRYAGLFKLQAAGYL
jgi:ATP-binding cassette subfamily B protein